MTNAEIAAAYLAYAKDQGEANQWAADSVMDLTYEDRWDDLWDIVLAMSRDPADVDLGALAFVAAGPVEDLICQAGPAYIDRILHESSPTRDSAACSPAFGCAARIRPFASA